jgi:hypothetical protein
MFSDVQLREFGLLNSARNWHWWLREETFITFIRCGNVRSSETLYALTR